MARAKPKKLEGEFHQKVADWIRASRQKHDWTLTEMADRLGVRGPQISKHENLTQAPEFESLIRYAAVTGSTESLMNLVRDLVRAEKASG